MNRLKRLLERIARRFLLQLPRFLLIPAARMLADVRPLGPYPGWRFAVEELKPTPLVNLRKAIWDRFRDDSWTNSVRVAWHHGLVLDLVLGNDLSRCMYVSGSFEPNEFAWLEGQVGPEMVVLDIGANEGFFTTYLARKVGDSGLVIAFEPSPREVQRLQRNIAINGLSNVRVVTSALSDHVGRATFHVADAEHNGQNTLGTFGHAGVGEAGQFEVDLVRLDDVFPEYQRSRLDLIKMDVEGAEWAVLKGAREIIERFRPIILLEVFDAALRGQGGSATELLTWLKDHHYALSEFSPATGLLAPLQEFPITSINVVAIPDVH
jgi:FkbM family methyltransferase